MSGASPLWPHLTLTVSQRSHLQIPSTGGLGHQHLHLGGEQTHSVHITYNMYLGFPSGSVVKNPPVNAGDTGLILGLGEGNGNPLQHPCLGNARDGGAWWATIRGTTRSWTQLSDWAHRHPPDTSHGESRLTSFSLWGTVMPFNHLILPPPPALGWGPTSPRPHSTYSLYHVSHHRFPVHQQWDFEVPRVRWKYRQIPLWTCPAAENQARKRRRNVCWLHQALSP